MNRRQLNALAMYQSVLSHLDQFPAVWNQLAPITPVVDNLRKTVADLLAQSQLQEQNNTAGHTKNKDAHLYKLVEQAYQLSLKLRAYAKVNSDNVLLQDVNYSYSALESGAEQLVLQRCQRIAQHARNKLADLAAYQVTEADVTTLEQLLHDAPSLTPARNVVAGARKTATDSIPELVTQARHQLDVLDDLVEGMIMEHAFVSTYFNLRQVYDRVGRSAQVKEQS
jgi:hypothetical protein